jgi:uncharacterized protein YuzE
MNDKQRDSQSGKFDYDLLNDTLHVSHVECECVSSMMLDDIILDMNEDNEFIGVEVPKASKKYGVHKHELLSPLGLDYDIKISDNVVTVELKLTVKKRNHPVVRTISVAGTNDMNLAPASARLRFT